MQTGKASETFAILIPDTHGLDLVLKDEQGSAVAPRSKQKTNPNSFWCAMGKCFPPKKEGRVPHRSKERAVIGIQTTGLNTSNNDRGLQL